MLTESGSYQPEQPYYQPPESSNEEYKHQTPVYRTSPGKTVMTEAKRAQLAKKEQQEKEDFLQWTLTRLDFAETEDQAQSILDDYNETLGGSEQSGQILTKVVKSISLGGRSYKVHQSELADKKLLLLPEQMEKQKISVEQVWNELRQDKELLQILAYMTTGQFYNTDNITVENVKQFYREFPTDDAYMQDGRITQMINGLSNGNSNTPIYRKYNVKSSNFVDVMYPAD